MDGASHSRIFRTIVLPLTLPAIASLAIFLFLWIWNDLLLAITFTTGTADTAPVTAYLSGLEGAFGSKEYLLTAGAFVAIAIPLIVFFGFQRDLRAWPARGFGRRLITRSTAGEGRGGRTVGR